MKIKFGAFEGSAVLINSICLKIITGTIRMFVYRAGSAGWLLSIVSSLISVLLMLLIIRLYKNRELKTLTEYSKEKGGFFKYTVGMVLIAELLLFASASLRYGVDLNKTVALPTTPSYIIVIFIMGGAVISAYMGYEAIVRAHAISVPLIFSILALITVATTKEVNLNNIFPILGANSDEFIKNCFLLTSTFGETVIFYLIVPYLQNYRTVKKTGITAAAVSGVFIVFSVLYYVMLIPYPASVEFVAPFYQFSRLISFSRFLNQLEAFYVILWNISVLIYCANMLWLICTITRDIFNMKSIKPLIIPYGIVIASASGIYKNIINYTSASDIYLWIVVAISFLLPLLVLTVTKARRGKSNGL